MLKALRRRLASMFDIPEEVADVIYNVSNVLVLLGAVGGIGIFWAGGIREKFAALRETDSEKRIAEAGAVAAQATKAAGEANEAAGKANERAASLEVEAETARSNIAAANEAAANANERAAELERQTEIARLELFKLQQAAFPRTITPEQQAAFLKSLSGAPKRRVDVVTYATKQEAVEYAKQLRAMLDAAALNGDNRGAVVGPRLDSAGTGATVGVLFASRDEIGSNADLLRAFAAAGVHVIAGTDGVSPEAGVIVVAVADK
jgi:hypothetical protein